MPDMFEVQEKVSEVLSLLTYHSKAQAVARLRRWLMETELEINQFETAQWEEHMEENYQMTLMEKGLVKY